MKQEKEIKTDNGWYSIEDIKPNEEEEVIVIIERDSSPGCTYYFSICETIYRNGYPKGYFLVENEVWKVRYWRRKEKYPYPNGIVKREIEECKKHNVSIESIIDYQRSCGINVQEYLS